MKNLYDFKRERFAAIIDGSVPLDSKFDLLTASYNKWLDVHVPKYLHISADDLLYSVAAKTHTLNWSGLNEMEDDVLEIPDVEYQALRDFVVAWEYLEQRRYGPRTTPDDSAQVEWHNYDFKGKPIYRD